MDDDRLGVVRSEAEAHRPGRRKPLGEGWAVRSEQRVVVGRIRPVFRFLCAVVERDPDSVVFRFRLDFRGRVRKHEHLGPRRQATDHEDGRDLALPDSDLIFSAQFDRELPAAVANPAIDVAGAPRRVR